MKTTKLLSWLLMLAALTFGLISCSSDSSEATAPNTKASVYGKVTDKDTQQPIKDAIVSINETGENKTTGTDGLYRFENLEPNKEYTLVSSKAGYKATTETIKLNSSEQREKNIVMETLKPVLAVDLLELNYGISANEKTLQLSNTGTGTLTYTLSADASWISFEPAATGSLNATEVKNIVVKINRAGLAYGTYNKKITANSNGGSKVIDVIVVIPDPNSPTIVLSSQNLNFGETESTLPLTITNAGNGTLNWTIVKVAGANWLSLSTAAGATSTTAATVSLSANRNGLTPGDYTEKLKVTSNDPNSAEIFVDIAMKVSNIPVITTSADTLDFGSGMTLINLTISNGGNGTLTWNIGTSQAGWLSFAPSSGTNQGTVGVTVTRTGLAQGAYSSELNITATGATAKKVIVKMAVALPGSIVLNTPQNNSLNVPVKPTFSWSTAKEKSGSAKVAAKTVAKKETVLSGLTNKLFGVKTETSYHLQVATNQNFTTPALDLENITVENYTMESNLNNNTKYFWRVRAKNLSGYGAWSTINNFTTIEAVPNVPVLVAPANNATAIELTPSLNWTISKDFGSFAKGFISGKTKTKGVTYSVQVSEYANFASTIISIDTVTVTSYKVPSGKLAFSKSYYWRVMAKTPGGNSSWSSAFKFTTSLQVPSLTLPADGAVGVSVTPAFSWQTTEGATGYKIQVSENTGFTSTVINQSVTANNFTPSAGVLSGSKTYYWRVAGVYAGGTSLWSANRTFTTIAGVPTLTTPTNNATNVSVTPTLVWSAKGLKAGRSLTYELTIAKDAAFTNVVINKANISTTQYAVSAGELTSLSSYYWKVRANNEGGTSDWSTVFKFTTRTSNWVELNTGIPSTVSIYNIDALPDGKIFVRTSNGLYRSLDNGDSFELVNSTSGDLILDDTIPLNNGNFIYDNNGAIYLTMHSNHNSKIYRSSNNGTSWTIVYTEPMPGATTARNFCRDNNGKLYYVSHTYSGGTFQMSILSSSNGTTWSSIGNQFTTSFGFSLDIIDENNIYLAGYSGYFKKSVDGGYTWQDMPFTYSGSYNFSYIIHYTTANLTYQFVNGYSGNSVVRSKNYGVTWQALASNISGLTPGSLTYSQFNKILIGNGNNGVCYSQDNGETWLMFSGLVNQYYNALTVNQNNGNIYVSGENNKIYRYIP